MATREEVVERFEVEGTSGNTYEVQKLQTYVYVDGLQGRGRGSHRYALASGTSVDRRSDTEFHILWMDRDENEVAMLIE